MPFPMLRAMANITGYGYCPTCDDGTTITGIWISCHTIHFHLNWNDPYKSQTYLL